MGKSIQELRRDAGFRSAREFAEECGFSPSSLARYEKEPAAIPMKSAWVMADVLGCSIDDIAGRDEPTTADLRGSIQVRYDELPTSLKASLDDYLCFLEMKADEAESSYNQEMEDCYMNMFKLYLVMFMEGMGSEEKEDILIHGASVNTRAKFIEFLGDKVFEKWSSFIDGQEVMAGVMRAYDKFYPKPRSIGLL